MDLIDGLSKANSLDFFYIIGFFDLKYLSILKEFLLKNPNTKVFVLEINSKNFNQKIFFEIKAQLQEFSNFAFIIRSQNFTNIEEELAVNYLNAKIGYCFGKKLNQKKYERCVKIFEKVKIINYQRSLYLIEMMGQDLIFRNFYHQAKKIHQQFDLYTAKGVLKEIPAIICGGGDSLYEQMELLKTVSNKAVIFAAGTAISSLSKFYVEPNFLVATCPRPTEQKSLKENIFFRTTVIQTPRLNADSYYYLHGISGISLHKDLLSDNILSSILQWQVEENNERYDSMTVLGLALRQAISMGCNPIFLCGIDLKDNSIDKSFEWELEKRWLEDFAKIHHEKMIFTCSKKGTQFENVPFIELSQAINLFCKREYDLEGIVESIAKPLFSPQKEQKIVEFFQAIEKSFLNIQDYLNLLNEYMNQGLKLYDFRVLDLIESLESECGYQNYLKPVARCLQSLETKTDSIGDYEIKERIIFNEQLKLFSAIVPRYLKIFKESLPC